MVSVVMIVLYTILPQQHIVVFVLGNETIFITVT